MARTLSFLLLVALGTCLVDAPSPSTVRKGDDSVREGATRSFGERTVILGCNLSDEDVITVTTSLAARGQGTEILLDSANAGSHLKAFLARFRPHQVVPIGPLFEG